MWENGGFSKLIVQCGKPLSQQQLIHHRGVEQYRQPAGILVLGKTILSSFASHSAIQYGKEGEKYSGNHAMLELLGLC